MEYTEALWSTVPFRRWSAITAIAGALERRVWIRSQSANIYPNLYTFLVGPPAAGKTRAASICEEFWKALPHATEYEFHLAPTSLTKASLMDALASAARSDPRIEPSVYNSLLIISKELGALIPGYDADFLNALTYIYDNESYSEKRRGNKDGLFIERPQINLLGCTTPSFLMDTMPDSAWDQGFLSRVIIIYKDIVGERRLNLEEEELPRDKTLANALIHDIKAIADAHGKLTFTKEAATHLSAWADDEENRPGHPRLQNYVTRRPIHAIKLSMIACIDKGHNVIELEDTQSAVNWITEAEVEMGNMFLAFKTGGDASIMNEAQHFLRTLETRSGEPVPMSRLWQWLSERVPSYRIQPLIDTLIRAGMVETYVVNGVTLLIIKAKLL